MHLGAKVDKVSIYPTELSRFDGEYDGNLDTELLDNDQAAIFVCKQKRWQELQALLNARGFPTRALGDSFNNRVIFRILPKTAP